MSINFLPAENETLQELNESRINIDNRFQKQKLDLFMSKFEHIIISEWDRDYPISLPENVHTLELKCAYNFPLSNLPPNIRVLKIKYDYKYPLENLPLNLHQLEIEYDEFSNKKYINTIAFLPNSIEILNLNGVFNQLSCNLPLRLKQLEFTYNTFSNEFIEYPQQLEKISLTAEQLTDCKLNLINLPLSLKSIKLKTDKAPNLDNILNRLINLEELYINFSLEDNTFSNIPASVKYIYIKNRGNSDNSFNFLSSSNIKHIHLSTRDSIINYIPKTLQKITLYNYHNEIFQIREKYPHLDIDIIKNLDIDIITIRDQEDVLPGFTMKKQSR